MIESKIAKVKKYLNTYSGGFAPITGKDWIPDNICVLDLSKNNEQLTHIDTKDIEAFSNFIFKTIHNSGSKYGYGGYDEDRSLYAHYQNFAKGGIRSIHLGIDLWAPQNACLYAPIEGRVHSFKNNIEPSDYGPTIIMEHAFENLKFYLLFGHLSEDSLEGLQEGQPILKGEQFAKIGATEINGGWPPHLHFQIIADIDGYYGDYPGVSTPSERDYYLKNCPDPSLILMNNMS